MKHRRLPAAHSRTRTLVPAVLGALVLSACGGDSSSHHDSSAGPLKITDDNAANITLQAFSAQEFLPSLLPEFAYASYYLAADADCLTGSSELKQNDDEPPESVSFDECVYADEDDGTQRSYGIIDGGLDYAFEDEGSIYQIDFQRLSSSLEQSDETNSLALDVNMDGSVRIDETSPLPSLSEGNFTLKLDVQGEGDMELPSISMNLSVKDWSIISEMVSSDLMSLTIAGRLTLLDDDLNGYLDLVTNTPLTNSTDDCPQSGDITANGADNTSINVYFVNSDQITLTINGVAQPDMTCDGFYQWMGGDMPFKLSGNALPFGLR